MNEYLASIDDAISHGAAECESEAIQKDLSWLVQAAKLAHSALISHAFCEHYGTCVIDAPRDCNCDVCPEVRAALHYPEQG